MPPFRLLSADIASAVTDVNENHLSVRKAAQKWGIPRSTLSDRLNNPQLGEAGQPAQRLSSAQEEALLVWILRQEQLGLAASHSAVRRIVEKLSEANGDTRPLGKHWIEGFLGRHPEIKTKIGKRQESLRFKNFTKKSVDWYFDIREDYSWVKPSNTYNLDEGGVMSGYGLDSLVLGSTETKKAFVKSPQSRAWTSFIEAIAADGFACTPGIIFKGKDLQTQWFLDKFRKVADWYYICSENGWTSNDIAVEWLLRVFLPQAGPRRNNDPSEAILLLLNGHKSHTSDEFMAEAFFNNVNLCFLPAHTSHGLQPLDNGPFNALKSHYRKYLQQLSSLTDAAPVDKIEFLQCYANARRDALTSKTIKAGFRTTGNWPISRIKALSHPELQVERPKTPEPEEPAAEGPIPSTPSNAAQIRDLGKGRSPTTRWQFKKASDAYQKLAFKVETQAQAIASLKAQLEKAQKKKKRKKVPNPNARFMTIGEILAVGGTLEDINNEAGEAEEEEVEEEAGEEENDEDDEVVEVPAPRATRSGRETRRPARYTL